MRKLVKNYLSVLFGGVLFAVILTVSMTIGLCFFEWSLKPISETIELITWVVSTIEGKWIRFLLFLPLPLAIAFTFESANNGGDRT